MKCIKFSTYLNFLNKSRFLLQGSYSEDHEVPLTCPNGPYNLDLLLKSIWKKPSNMVLSSTFLIGHQTHLSNLWIDDELESSCLTVKHKSSGLLNQLKLNSYRYGRALIMPKSVRLIYLCTVSKVL